jgi:protein TonB
MSALAHGALIAAIVALTLPGRGSARTAPDVHPTTVTYVRPSTADAPPAPRASTPRATTASRSSLPIVEPPIITPVGIPPIDLSVPVSSSNDIRIGARSDLTGSVVSSPGIPLGGSGAVRDASAVDRAPGIIGRALEPRYPAALRAAGVEGRVLAEFVVDTTGRAELSTLRFPELPDPRFGDAVREALAHYRFSPGEVAGRTVRTRVAVPFDFRLVR